ncbi:MAG TPA: hypothetical protein VFP83_03260 [Candidatus Limnocylindria bacterium]|nr:hypothetical protein [Candidatus Limnocylindria bacterium]
MARRSPLTIIAGVLLLAWAGMLAYVSVPTLLSDDPFWDGGISVLGAFIASAHLAAGVGVLARAWWGRQLGLVMGWIGLFGTVAVVGTLAASMLSTDLPQETPLVLAIPAGMAILYAVIVFALWRAKAEFAPGVGAD